MIIMITNDDSENKGYDMDIFSVLTLIGGLSLFLFGMNVMGQALERRAGGSLRGVLGKMTGNKWAGFATGAGVTAVIQSSSAATVMVVGFVNSGLMTLRQAIHVIMGANVGTTITGWVLSLGGIRGDSLWIRLLKPSSFTPVFALVGVILYLFQKNAKKKDTGLILLGFSTLMFGMETMSSSVAGLAEVPGFGRLFLLFRNPLAGLLAGAVLTMIIQSSSAAVGILQALAVTGQITYAAVIPIIMGDSIGTCVTAVLSGIGAKKEARRASLVHLFFNVIGAVVWLTVYLLWRFFFRPAILDESASLVGIAFVHTAFKVLSTVVLLPASRLLEKLVCALVPDGKAESGAKTLDERLLTTPPIALQRCRESTVDMARCAVRAMQNAVGALSRWSAEAVDGIRADEQTTDRYEDEIGTYLIRLSARRLSRADGEEVTELFKLIGDWERIGDHSLNLAAAAETMHERGLTFPAEAMEELTVLGDAVEEILALTLTAFADHDRKAARAVEPLEQVIDGLKEELRTRHIRRMKDGACPIDAGFLWSDLLIDMARAADHCANIAACLLDMEHHTLNLHERLRERRLNDSGFREKVRAYRQKYGLGASVG